MMSNRRANLQDQWSSFVVFCVCSVLFVIMLVQAMIGWEGDYTLLVIVIANLALALYGAVSMWKKLRKLKSEAAKMSATKPEV